MMIWWQEHSEKGVTDRQTDRQTDWTIYRAAWSQLKMLDKMLDIETMMVKQKQLHVCLDLN